jgi:hypothetical protein
MMAALGFKLTDEYVSGLLETFGDWIDNQGLVLDGADQHGDDLDVEQKVILLGGFLDLWAHLG